MDRIPERLLGKKVEGRREESTLCVTISLDIIFILLPDGRKVPYVVEINGEKSGTKGYVEATKHARGLGRLRHIMGAIRAQDNEEFWDIEKKLRAFTEKVNILRKDNSLSPEGVRRAVAIMQPHIERQNELTMMTHSYKNDWDIENYAMRKDMQSCILGEFAPRTYVPGDSLVSRTGYWILKPKDGVGGRNIHIASNNDFYWYTKDYDLQGEGYIAQEFHVAWNADLDRRRGHHPAALRVMIDFGYYEKTGVVDIHTACVYQRASQDEITPEDLLRIATRKKHIINLGTGALAFEASEEERRVALALAECVAGRLSRKVLDDRRLAALTKRAQEFSLEKDD